MHLPFAQARHLVQQAVDIGLLWPGSIGKQHELGILTVRSLEFFEKQASASWR